MNSPSVIRPSINRRIHKLNLTYNSSNDVSMLSLSQLLDLLHQNNIRYAPSASREQLEDLLQTHLMNSANQRTPFGSSRSKTRNKIASIDGKNDAIVNGVNDIVDAVVLPEQTHHETDERYKGRRRYQHTNQTQNKRPRRRKESYNNYHQQEARHSRYRQKKQNYDSNDNIIDAVFDLPDMPSTDATYENGLQIFLMGFAEAGKTAAELAVDAATKTIHLPFSDDAEYDGYDVDHIQRYWDSELNRRPKRRTGRRRRQFSSNESRMDQRETQSLVPSRRNVQSYDDSTLAGFESTQVQQRLPNRPRHSKNDNGQPKPIYGLEYVHDNERAKNEDMIPRQYRQLSHHKQQWKDRLRKKFDAALGIEPTTSSIEKESYYDSWKRNMREMDDTHKDRVRWKITDKVNTTPEVPNHTQTRMTATRVPQNRRARMTAAKAKIPNEPALPDSIQVAAAQKTRATKFESKLRSADRPFWKERGSIASLLFDNNSSSWKRDIQKKNKRTLEVSQSVYIHWHFG